MKQVFLSALLYFASGFAWGSDLNQTRQLESWSDVAIYASEINTDQPQLGLQVIVKNSAGEADVVLQLDSLRDDLYGGIQARSNSLNMLKCNHPACDGTMHMTVPMQMRKCNHPACDGTMRMKWDQ